MLVETAHIFVKQVTEAVTEEQLSEVLNKVGPVKSCNISRARNCAFVEFNTIESCQKALAQHRFVVGGGQHVVFAEERRFNNQNNRYSNGGRVQQQPYDRRTTNNNRRGGSNGQPRVNNQTGKGRGAPAPPAPK